MDTITPCIFCGQDRDRSSATCPTCGRGWIDRRLPGSTRTWTPPPPGDTDEPTLTTASGLPMPAAATPRGSEPGTETPSTDAERHPPVTAATSDPRAPDRASDPVTGPSDRGRSDTVASESPAGTITPESTAVVAPGGGSAGADGGDAGRSKKGRILAAAAVVAIGAISFLIFDGITGDAPPTALPTTTLAGAGATATSLGTVATTTTPATTSTTTSTTTTTTLVPIVAEGDPLATEDLALGGFALGPFAFGDSAALGRLVATFGQPDAVGDAGPDLGLCEPDSGVAVTWGPLTAVFAGTLEDATLVAYRLEENGDHPAAALTTLSGLQLGATVAELRDIYGGFEVGFADRDGTPVFVLVRNTDGATLLWGPVTSTDDAGVVGGIFSPLPCDGGPEVAP